MLGFCLGCHTTRQERVRGPETNLHSLTCQRPVSAYTRAGCNLAAKNHLHHPHPPPPPLPRPPKKKPLMMAQDHRILHVVDFIFTAFFFVNTQKKNPEKVKNSLRELSRNHFTFNSSIWKKNHHLTQYTDNTRFNFWNFCLLFFIWKFLKIHPVTSIKKKICPKLSRQN